MCIRDSGQALDLIDQVAAADVGVVGERLLAHTYFLEHRAFRGVIYSRVPTGRSPRVSSMVRRSPSRITSRETWSPGRLSAISRARSSGRITGSPSTATITSPPV